MSRWPIGLKPIQERASLIVGLENRGEVMSICGSYRKSKDGESVL
jgi:hypothetical protein